MSTPPSPPASATLVVGSPPTKRQKVIDSSVSIDAAAATAPTATAAPADIIITTTTTTTVVENSSTIDERTETAVETVTLPVTTLSAEEEEAMEPIPPLQIKKLAPEAKLPTRGSEFAAGYDLYASRDTVVPARGKVLVDTDISMACPVGTYGRIAPRSGLAAKHHIDTGAGVIDADYRGPVKVLLFNHAETDFPVSAGDRVAQLVLERIVNPDVVEVQELQESVRGGGGFGSTGTN